MFNYRTSPHGIRPTGGNYFRTPPGQRTQRQSFNRPIPTTNKPISSSKPMGSRLPQTSPKNIVKQGEKSHYQEAKLSAPSVEQSSPVPNKMEEKGASDNQTSPAVVQQTTKLSTTKQDTSESAGPTSSSSKRPASPPIFPPPEKTLQQSISSKEPANAKSKEEDEMSWSPPPPEPPQKPLTIPLSSGGDFSQRTDTNKVPYGAALTHKTSYSGRGESDIKDESASNVNDPPFQSQVMKGQGHQYKKPTQYRYNRPPQQQHQQTPASQQQQQQHQENTAPQEETTTTMVQRQQTAPEIHEPVQTESANMENRQREKPTERENLQQQTPTQQLQQGAGNFPFGRRRPGGPIGPGKWGKTDRPRRSDPAPSPMETDYEMDPKVDRSILDTEPKEHVKKFTNRCRLFIGGILNADEKLLKDMFIKFGEISELWLNKEKGFGFVKMDTKANAQRAIDHYNGQERMSSMVRVRFAAKNSSVKVSNLTHPVSNELLEEAFRIFGDVEHAVVACDERGKSLGWGIVDFAMKKSASHAITRCKEGLYMLCKSPIPIMVTELKDEDLEEGVVEKTMHKNILHQREREDGPRFATPGSMDYQIGMKWKRFLENARSERDMLEERLKAERIQIENETEGELIHYLEEQDNLRHQESLRRQEEQRRLEETKRQEYARTQEMIKQENRRRNQSMRMQEDLKRREDSLRRDDFMQGVDERNFNRPFGGTQAQQPEISFGYSQDYEHGYNSEKNQEWQQSAGSSYKKEWGGESAQGYGGTGYQSQGRSAQSGYDDYPGYLSQSQYEQRHQGGGQQQYGDDVYNKERTASSQGHQGQYGSGDQYRSEPRHSGGGGYGYGGYSGGAGAQSSGDSYRGGYGGTTQSGGSGGYHSDSGYGTGYGATSSQAAQGSADHSWTSQRQGQGGYEGMYQSGGVDSGEMGGGYDRRRPHTDDWQADNKMGYSFSGFEKRRKT